VSVCRQQLRQAGEPGLQRCRSRQHCQQHIVYTRFEKMITAPSMQSNPVYTRYHSVHALCMLGSITLPACLLLPCRGIYALTRRRGFLSIVHIPLACQALCVECIANMQPHHALARYALDCMCTCLLLPAGEASAGL
jgi:hypothetical protein